MSLMAIILRPLIVLLGATSVKPMMGHMAEQPVPVGGVFIMFVCHPTIADS